MRYILAGFALIAIAIWGTWLIAVPAGLIERKAEEDIRAQGIDADLAGFEKGWFYNFEADALHFRNKDATLLTIYKLKGRLDFAALASLRAALVFDGTLGGGRLKGSMGRGIFRDKAPAVGLDLKGARIEDMNLFALTGQQASGTLEAKAALHSGTGEFTFNVPDLKAGELNLSGARIPFEVSGRLMGRLSIKNRALELHSVSFEGDGLFARATGTVSASGNNVKLELMPEGDKFKDPGLAAFMSGFKVAKGRYVVSMGR